jgi:hypothetical protein
VIVEDQDLDIFGGLGRHPPQVDNDSEYQHPTSLPRVIEKRMEATAEQPQGSGPEYHWVQSRCFFVGAAVVSTSHVGISGVGSRVGTASSSSCGRTAIATPRPSGFAASGEGSSPSGASNCLEAHGSGSVMSHSWPGAEFRASLPYWSTNRSKSAFVSGYHLSGFGYIVADTLLRSTFKRFAS